MNGTAYKSQQESNLWHMKALKSVSCAHNGKH